MRRLVRIAAAVVSPLLIGLIPAVAGASTTIGQIAAGSATGCSPNTAYKQGALSSGPGYTAGTYGVITGWSARASSGPGQQVLKLTVLRANPPGGPNAFITVAKDESRTLTQINAINDFRAGVRLPIEAGEQIGLSVPFPGSTASPCVIDVGGGSENELRFATGGDPLIGDSLDYATGNPGFRLNALATVEPDLDRDVFGDETQDKCVGTPGTANGCPSTVTINKLKQKGDTKVRVTATVPGAGTLQVGSASDKALAGKAAKSLKAVSKAVTGITTQQLMLTLKLTKSAIGKLDDKGKLKLRVKAVYTPTGGQPGSQTKKKKLTS